MATLFGQAGKEVTNKSSWILIKESIEGFPQDMIEKVTSCKYYEGPHGGFLAIKTYSEEFKFPVDKVCISKYSLEHNTDIDVSTVIHYKRKLINPDTGEDVLTEEGGLTIKSMVYGKPVIL